MSQFNNPLYDKEFLKELDNCKNKEIFARIIALTFDEQSIECIEGRVTSGNVNIDGASAIRRTCSLSLVAKELNINDFYWGLKNKFKLEIGVRNLINSNYSDIIWFKQGVYTISSFSTNQTTNNYTISISGKDKGCYLNGELGGNLPASVDFGVEEYIDKENNITYYYKIPIKKIIREMLHAYALEPYHNIVINDLETAGLELLEYRGDEPLYLLYDKDSGEFTQAKRAAEKNLTCYDKDGNEKQIDNLDPTQYLIIIKNKENYNSALEIKLSADSEKYYQVLKMEYGQTAGYRLTELVYAGDLIANIGETITSVLDKIKNMLGEFEYFYDLDGRFVFQAKKNYVNTVFNNKITNEDETTYIDNSAYNDQFVYKFEGGNLISSYQNSPNLSNLKNDFSIWGNRKGVGDADIPIHYRYAIDKKPIYYKSYAATEKINGEEVQIGGVEYYASRLDAMQDYNDTTLSEKELAGTIVICDWREIIYQMALDYYKYNQQDDFLINIENNNKKLDGISYYPGGTTGYERYYTDIQGFWRQLYDPKPEQVYSDNLNKNNAEYFVYSEDLYPYGLYTNFKYEPYKEDLHKNVDRKNIEVLWENHIYEKVKSAKEKAEDFEKYYIENDGKYILAKDEKENAAYDNKKTYYIRKEQPKYVQIKSPLKNNYNDYYSILSDAYEKVADTATYDSKEDYYQIEYYDIPEGSWNKYTWDATNLEVLKDNYFYKDYVEIEIVSKEKFKEYTNANKNNKIYIKNAISYNKVGANDYYSKDNEYYEIGYEQITGTESEQETLFKNRKTEKWYTKAGDVYTVVSSSAKFNKNTIYYRQTYQIVENPQINFKTKKSGYYILAPEKYTIVSSFQKGITKYYIYTTKSLEELGYDKNKHYCYKTFKKVTASLSTFKNYYILKENIDNCYFLPSSIKLPFDSKSFKYYRKNTVQLQPLIDTIEVDYSDNKYYITCQIDEKNPDGFKLITNSAKSTVEKEELFLRVQTDKEDEFLYTQVKSTDKFDANKIYCVKNYEQIVFLNEVNFDPKNNEYYIQNSKGAYTKVLSTAKYDSKKTYYEAVYEVEQLTEEIFNKNKTHYYTKTNKKVYVYRTLLEMAEPTDNWQVKISENEKYYDLLNWIGENEKLHPIFYHNKEKNQFISNLKRNELDFYGSIDETKPLISTQIEYYTKTYDYYTESTSDNDSDNRKNWNYAVYDAPDTLNFWFEFLDTDGELSQYSIPLVGDRSKVVNDKDVKSIYFRDVPNIIFIDSNKNKEKTPGDLSLSEEELLELSGYWHYTRIRNIPINLFTVSGQGKSAQDALDTLLYNHSYCIETITLQAIPIYYLEPNTRILVYDDMSKINGEYLVSKISLPLAYNGMMTINATKAPTRLY